MTTNTPSPGPSRPTHSIAPAATALAVLASAGSAAAQVTFFNPPGATITPGSTLYIDIDGGSFSTSSYAGSEFSFSFYAANPGDPRLAGYSPKAAVSAVKPHYPYGYVARLSHNTLINGSDFVPAPNKPMVQGAYGSNGPWYGGGSGYIGFGWMPGGSPRYGWMDVTYDTSGGGSLTVNGWAYDTNGNFVSAGSLVAIPEPATTTAVMGAAILTGSAVMMRRRREKLAAAAA